MRHQSIEARDYRIDPAFRRLMRSGAFISLVMAAVVLVVGQVDEPFPRAAAALSVCIAAVSSRLARSHADRFAVAVDASGIRSLDPKHTHRHLSWGAISGARERVYLQRLDLLTTTGEPPLRLDYVLGDFDDLLATLLDAAPGAGSAHPLPTTFGWRPPIEVGKRLICVGGRSARRIPLDEVARPVLHLQRLGKVRALCPKVCLHSGKVIRLPLNGGNAFDLHRTIERALADRPTQDRPSRPWRGSKPPAPA